MTASSEISAQRDYAPYEVSLLTFSSGSELFTSFGHSAIRIRDGRDDWVYNYGTFDFEDPGFYLGFVTGNLQYRLSRVPFDFVRKSTMQEERGLVETPLRLTTAEKERMIRFLDVNYLPENQAYRYDFLYNNCATKITELINHAAQNRTIYNPMVIPPVSFRQLLSPYLHDRPWTRMGADLLMGLPADRTIQGTDASFLPDYLHLLIKNARIAGLDGSDVPLSYPDVLLHHRNKDSSHSTISPGWILWPLVLITVIASFLGSYITGVIRVIQLSMVVIAGTLGVILLTLWMLSDHHIFSYNTDLLWANPLLLFLFIKPAKQTGFHHRFTTLLLYIIAALCFMGFVTSLLLEKNQNLSALAALTLLAVIDRIRMRKKINSTPELLLK